MPQANVAQLAEQRTRNAQVKSSNLFIGSIRGVAQLGSAFGSGPKGRVFKSPRPDHEKSKVLPCFFHTVNLLKAFEISDDGNVLATFCTARRMPWQLLCLTKRSKHLFCICVGLGLGQMGIYA